MNIVVGSIFRDSEAYIQRYYDQIEALKAAAPQHSVRCILAEGDSVDGSHEKLKALFDGQVFKRAHGGPKFGSVCDPVRHRQMSYVYEGVLERVKPADDIFVYVESDLIWHPTAILQLMERLKEPGVDISCPFIWYQNRFYDSWGYVGVDGVHFGFYFPFHMELLNPTPNGLYPLSSAGSCLVMKAEVARKCHFEPPEICVAGFMQDAVKTGYKLWMDPNIGVRHPA